MEISKIGYWSEIKLEIVRKYAVAYSTIISKQKQPNFKHVYIDAFAGAGFHQAKSNDALVWGSPLQALLINPPFKEYHFVDLDQGKVETLEEIVKTRKTGPFNPETVHIYNADSNKILLEKIFPLVKYENYCRGLCLLDPYGLHLDWDVIYKAGQMRSIEVFLNFPIADMNRNILRHNQSKVEPAQIERLNRYWGDESWRNAAYATEGNLFGFEEKTSNLALANSFRKRLKEVAGFTYVPTPLPMRNSKNAIIYYLFFASHKPTAEKIVTQIFKKYSNYGK